MDYIRNIEKGGFVFVPRRMQQKLSPLIMMRYQNIPTEYLSFLSQFERITNRKNTTWFLSIEDFNGDSKTGLAWNAFELMSLETFEGNQRESEKVRHFWNTHIPVLLSMKEYEYLAISLNADRYGEIVHGCEPEFEETSRVCDNFGQMMNLIEKSRDNEYFRFFL